MYEYQEFKVVDLPSLFLFGSLFSFDFIFICAFIYCQPYLPERPPQNSRGNTSGGLAAAQLECGSLLLSPFSKDPVTPLRPLPWLNSFPYVQESLPPYALLSFSFLKLGIFPRNDRF